MCFNSNDFRGLEWIGYCAMFGLLVGLPLAIYELVRLVIWLANHVMVQW